MILEIVGYIGSALVVVSMLMSSIVKLRLFNLIGSIISGTYAVLCGALPLALLNAFLIVINLINLVKLSKGKQEETFDLVRTNTSDVLLQHFLNNYEADIKQHCPAYQPEHETPLTAFVVSREGVPVGVMIGQQSGDRLEVETDYSAPAYRDCSVGYYLHKTLPQQGVHELTSTGTVTEKHTKYLQKMGYVKEGNQWVCKLS